ncbi:MAG: hypothetical protein GY810_23110 [Aureispira sp.]|nr:hypothetical protein [Aureispira sp.]
MGLMQVTPDYLGGADGIQDILNNYYEQQIASMGNAAEQLAVRKLIEEGLIVDGTRVSLADAIVKNNYEIEDDLLERLLHTRLIRGENTHLGRAYEVSHDTLVEPILKSYEKRYVQEQLAEQERKLAVEEQKRQKARRIIIGVSALAVVAVIGMIVSVIALGNARMANEEVLKTNNELQLAKKIDSFSMVEKYAKEALTYNRYREAYQGVNSLLDKIPYKFPKVLVGERELKETEVFLGKYFMDLISLLWQTKYNNRVLYKLHNKIYLSADFFRSKGRVASYYPEQNLMFKHQGFAGFILNRTAKGDSISVPYGKFPEQTFAKKTFLAEEAERIVFIDSNEYVVLLDFANEKELFKLDESFQKKYKIYDSELVLARDGKYVLFSSEYQLLVVDNNGELVYSAPIESGSLENVSYEIRNDYLYYNLNGQLKLVDLKTKEERIIYGLEGEYVEGFYSFKDKLVLITEDLEGIFLSKDGDFLEKQKIEPPRKSNGSQMQFQEQGIEEPEVGMYTYGSMGGIGKGKSHRTTLTFIEKISSSVLVMGYENDLILWDIKKGKSHWLYGGNWKGTQHPSVALIDDRYTAVLRNNDLILFDKEKGMAVIKYIIADVFIKGASISCYKNRYLIIALPKTNGSFILDLKMRELEYIPKVDNYNYSKKEANIYSVQGQEIVVNDALSKKELHRCPSPHDVELSWNVLGLPNKRFLLQSCEVFSKQSMLLDWDGNVLANLRNTIVSADEQQIIEVDNSILKWYDLDGNVEKSYHVKEEGYNSIVKLELSTDGTKALVIMGEKGGKERAILLLNTELLSHTFLGISKTEPALLFQQLKSKKELAIMGNDKGVMVFDAATHKLLDRWTGNYVHTLFWGSLYGTEYQFPEKPKSGLFVFGEDYSWFSLSKGKLKQKGTYLNTDAIGEHPITPVTSIHGWLSQEGYIYSYGQYRVAMPKLSNYVYTKKHSILGQWNYADEQYLVELPLHPKVLDEGEKKGQAAYYKKIKLPYNL